MLDSFFRHNYDCELFVEWANLEDPEEPEATNATKRNTDIETTECLEDLPVRRTHLTQLDLSDPGRKEKDTAQKKALNPTPQNRKPQTPNPKP